MLKFNVILSSLLIFVSTQTLFAQNSGSQGDSNTNLAKESQNPTATMISLPFQNNVNFRDGPYKQTGDTVNIQPVIPIKVNSEFNILVRGVMPIMSQVRQSPTTGPVFGLGGSNLTIWASNARLIPFMSGGIFAGVGPSILLPTATDKRLGLSRTAVGPSIVVGYTGGPWVIGTLGYVNFSIPEYHAPQTYTYNQAAIQPFVNYNIANGWFVVTNPTITAKWPIKHGPAWTLPLGGGVGRVFKIGEQAVRLSAHAYYNVIRPYNASPWQLRTEFTLLFPEK